MKRPERSASDLSVDLRAAASQREPLEPLADELLPSLGTLPLSTRIDEHYHVLEEVAMFGGEADVFRCQDLRSGRMVALKVYRAGLRPRQELLQLLLEMRHSNLIPLLDFGLWHNRFFEVMHYAEGQSLLDAVPLEERLIVDRLLAQILSGLNYLHSNGVIHRDLKPANLFFMDRNRQHVVIADYGASSLIAEWEGSVHLSSTRRGTLVYAAPETFSGLFGAQADYYSLGMTLLVLVSGRSPFDRMTPQEIQHHHLTTRIQPPEACSPRFRDLIAGLLHKIRTERWGHGEVSRWLAGENVSVPHFAVAEPALRYRLHGGAIATSPHELGELLLNRPDEAKRHIQQRLVFDALRNYDQDMASRILEIQEKADNADQLFVEVVYTLNPELPYRLAPGLEAHSPAELAALIDRNQDTWRAGRDQLYRGMIPAWLRAVGHAEAADEWQKAEKTFRALPRTPPEDASFD